MRAESLPTKLAGGAWAPQGPGPALNGQPENIPNSPITGAIESVVAHPTDPNVVWVGTVNGGVFRTDDAGKTWRPINRGLTSEYIPEPTAEVGHCVHRIAMHRSRPNVLFMQKHWDVMRSDDAGETWLEVSGNLPTDFGFPIEVHAHEPDTVYVVPITSDSEHYPPEGKLRVYRSRSGGNEWEALTEGLPQRDCYVNVLRDAMTVDSLDPCGVYFGTTGGQVYCSADAGDSSEGRTAADNATVRSVLVIDPQRKIHAILTYPMTTGRNFDEVLRLLDSIQLTAKHKVATPVNWKQGEDEGVSARAVPRRRPR